MGRKNASFRFSRWLFHAFDNRIISRLDYGPCRMPRKDVWHRALPRPSGLMQVACCFKGASRFRTKGAAALFSRSYAKGANLDQETFVNIEFALICCSGASTVWGWRIPRCHLHFCHEGRVDWCYDGFDLPGLSEPRQGRGLPAQEQRNHALCTRQGTPQRDRHHHGRGRAHPGHAQRLAAGFPRALVCRFRPVNFQSIFRPLRALRSVHLTSGWVWRT